MFALYSCSPFAGLLTECATLQLAQSYQELLEYAPPTNPRAFQHHADHCFPTSEFANKDLKSVGNYTLGRLIGKGSFGKVYLATHKLTNGSKARWLFRILRDFLSDSVHHRSFSSQPTRMIRTLRARFTTIANSSTPTLPGCTR